MVKYILYRKTGKEFYNAYKDLKSKLKSMVVPGIINTNEFEMLEGLNYTIKISDVSHNLVGIHRLIFGFYLLKFDILETMNGIMLQTMLKKHYNIRFRPVWLVYGGESKLKKLLRFDACKN